VTVVLAPALDRAAADDRLSPGFVRTGDQTLIARIDEEPVNILPVRHIVGGRTANFAAQSVSTNSPVTLGRHRPAGSV
jgi:hypothetical protein